MPPYDDQLGALPAPVAAVDLWNPVTGPYLNGIRFLLDTGADLTLVPRGSIDALDVRLLSDRHLLMGFDGAITEAAGATLGLMFLGKRFRGEFLIVDAPTGILGRDVLNHFRLLLDGPALQWEQCV